MTTTAQLSVTHRLISRDGYKECFACGTKVEYGSDEDTDYIFDQIKCKPGGWTHPAYIVGGMTETCTAHETYECAHTANPFLIFESDYDEDTATGDCTGCGLPVEWDPRNAWTHAILFTTREVRTR